MPTLPKVTRTLLYVDFSQDILKIEELPEHVMYD